MDTGAGVKAGMGRRLISSTLISAQSQVTTLFLCDILCPPHVSYESFEYPSWLSKLPSTKYLQED